MTDKPSVSGNQHLGSKSGFSIIGQVNVVCVHQLSIAAQQRIGSGFRLNAMAGNFFYIQRTFHEKVLFPGSVYDADGDGVGGEQLAAGSQRQQLPGGNGIVRRNRCLHLEIALGDGAGLVHDHSLNAGQRFDGAAALEQDALLGRGADAGEEGQRHAEH